MNIWVFILALLIFLSGQHLLLALFAVKRITYSRHFSVDALHEGEKAELVEVLRNPTPIFIPWIRAESRISPFLRFGQQENLSVSGERFHKSIFFLGPFKQITRRHKVTFTHRGIYDVGSVALTVGDLVGLCDKPRDIHCDCKICVYPRLLNDESLPFSFSRLQGDMIVRAHYLPDPFLVNGIRSYRPGDQIHSIHWPATAKSGNLMVRTHDYTADTRLLVVLNAQLKENQWGNLMDYEMPAVEHAISLAATICVRLMQNGLNAGFCANMPMGDKKECVYFTPEKNYSSADELLYAFAALKITTAKSFLTFLESLYSLRDLDILILSAYTSPSVEERMQTLRKLGNHVTLHLLSEEAAS